jgi:hypothetical protein
VPRNRDSLLLTKAYARSKSMTTTMQALRFIVEYGPYADTVQDPDTLGTTADMDAYAEHMGISRAQAYRRQQAFRACFPKDDVMNLWRIVGPLLKESVFKAEHPRSQAVFIGTIKMTWV